MRGSIKGAIRVPSLSLSSLFNDLVFHRIPRKTLKSQSLLFSILTALPANWIDLLS